MKEINNIEEYKTLITKGKPVLLDFYADWCGPCQALLPVVTELAKENKDTFDIQKVNVDKQPELARKFGVRSIPALFFIKDGEIVEQLMGNQPKSILQDKITRHSSN